MSSKIEWTNSTWNPIAGCSAISPGCTNCYAARMARRLEAMGRRKYFGTTRRSGRRTVWTGIINCDERALELPLRWTTSRMIFVNSMSDLFHEDVPDQFVRRVWDIMERAHWHVFQVLTKRPERMQRLSRELRLLPNVWLGTSIENSNYLWRLEALRETRATVRFVSFEPLLGSVDEPDLSKIHWAIVGGESGPRARPIAAEWVYDIERACRRHNVAFFFKQWGRWDMNPLVRRDGLSVEEAKRRDPDPAAKGGAGLDGELIREMPEPAHAGAPSYSATA